MNENDDLYEILQVHHAAEPEVIEAAYRRLLRMYHPDVNKTSKAHDITVRLNAAYEVLSNSAKRADYDRQRGSQTESGRQRERRAERERQARAEQERQQREREAQADGEKRAESRNMTDHEFWQQTRQNKDDSNWVGYLILWGVVNALIFLVANGLGGFLIAMIIAMIISVSGLSVGWMIYDRWQSKRMWSNIPRDRDDGPS